MDKIKNINSGSNLKKLRTVDAHPIFTGSYKKIQQSGVYLKPTAILPISNS